MRKLIKIPVWLRVVLILLVILIGGFSIVVYITTRPQITGSLSDRSKEYLEAQKNQNDSAFNGKDFDKQKAELPQSTGMVDVDGCFSLDVPFEVKEKRSKDKCFVQFLIENPKGFVVAYSREAPVDTIDELPDVLMRRSKSEDYKEDKVQVNGETYYLFKKNGQEYEKIALDLRSDGTLLTISISANTNQDLDSKMDLLLKSVKLN